MANANPSTPEDPKAGKKAPEPKAVDPKELAAEQGGKVVERNGRKVVESTVKHKSGDILRRTYMDTRPA